MSPEMQANALLKKSIDRKLCYGNNAESLLRKAYEFAKEQELYDPWLRIAAYRLAHCLFRKARTEVEVTEVLQLFEEAAADVDKVLKPKAKLYALAAKIRLGFAEQDEFNQLVESVKYQFREDQSSQPVSRVVQSEVVNQLELLAYVGGFNYELLEGLNPPIYKIDPFDSNWRVLGSLEFDQHLFAKEYALGIARRYAIQNSDAVVCTWSDSEEVYKCIGPLADLEIKHTFSPMLIGPIRGDTRALDTLQGDRTTKRRLNEFIKKLSGEPLFPVSGSFTVNPKLKCLVVIPDELIVR